MTDKEIEAGIKRACECDCAPPSTGWTVNPFPIIHDYIERLKHRAEVAEERLKKLKKTEGDLTVEEEINILENLVEEAKHRSFVFERELVKHKIALATVCEEVLHAMYPVEYVTVSVVEDFIQLTLKDAEKELAEGSGGKKEV